MKQNNSLSHFVGQVPTFAKIFQRSFEKSSKTIAAEGKAKVGHAYLAGMGAEICVYWSIQIEGISEMRLLDDPIPETRICSSCFRHDSWLEMNSFKVRIKAE